MDRSCAVHDFQPVNYMRATYRCSVCGGFAYKPKIKTDGVSKFRTNDLVMYKCYKTGCADRVVVIFPVVKGVKRHQPSCSAHRRDRPPQAEPPGER